MSHLNALQFRLSNERIRLANAKTEVEKVFRKGTVAGIEREIAGEIEFLGGKIELSTLSADELLAELEL